MKLLQKIMLSSLLLPGMNLFSSDSAAGDMSKIARYHVLGHLATKADEMSKPELGDYIAKALFPDNWEASLSASKRGYKDDTVHATLSRELKEMLPIVCMTEVLKLCETAKKEARVDVVNFACDNVLDL